MSRINILLGFSIFIAGSAGSGFAAAVRIVNLPAGDIPLETTKVLTVADSGTLFRGAADGSTRLTGGVAVRGWKKAADGVWEAPVPRLADETPVYAETLFVNGRRARRSRWPEQGFFRFTEMTQTVSSVSRGGFVISARPQRDLRELLATLPAEDFKYAQIIGRLKWDVERAPLLGFRDGALSFDAYPARSWCPWQRGNNHELENVRFAFTKPGDWFYDGAAGKILYRPLPDEKIVEAVIPHEGLETLLAVRGDRTFGQVVRDITFENVTFAFAAPVGKPGPTFLRAFQAAAKVSSAAVVVDGADNVRFRNCRFTHLGGYGVWFREGCRGGGLESCELTDLGAGGVRIGTFRQLYPASVKYRHAKEANPSAYVETAPWMTSGIVVDDCLIAHGGRFHAAGVGVLIGHASDCRVTHNEIADFFYTGVSIGWVWGYAGSPAQRNEISFNHIHDIGQRELADMGGIYTLGTSWGTAISNNVIHAVHTASYGGWGLYNDEGSEGIVLENNLVYDTDDASYHQHYGRGNVLRNNILLDSASGQIASTRNEDHQSFSVERNVIVWKKGGAFKQSYQGTAKERTKIGWASNVWWCASGAQDFNGTNFTAWAQRVGDVGSVFADPRFADWEKRDLALPPDSPALKLGFKPFDPSRAGRRTKRAGNLIR